MTSLTPDTTYYVRAYATSEPGTSYGEQVSFTTAAETIQLTITKQGEGDGTVTSSPIGLDCGNICSSAFQTTGAVILTAIPDASSQFAGWAGSEDCLDGEISTAGDIECSAIFDRRFPWLLILRGLNDHTVNSSEN